MPSMEEPAPNSTAPVFPKPGVTGLCVPISAPLVGDRKTKCALISAPLGERPQDLA